MLVFYKKEMLMSNYKIVASDLDGTLLNSANEVSQENFSAIAELVRRGVLFVPASGRTLCEIPLNILDNENIRYIIHSSGAVVYDKITNDTIKLCIPRELSAFIFDLLESYQCHITIRQHGQTFVNVLQMTKEQIDYNQVWDIHYELIDRQAVRLSDFDKKVREMDDIEMISLFFHDDSDIDRVKAALEATGRLIAAKACPHNIEISYIEAGKGNALSALVKSLGIPISEAVAVGDSANDLPMLSTVGLGLAVSNASNQVKAAAKEVICSNDEHAIKYILEKYIIE